jgi:hypothetical protein
LQIKPNQTNQPTKHTCQAKTQIKIQALLKHETYL